MAYAARVNGDDYFRVAKFRAKLCFLSPSTIQEMTGILQKDPEDRTPTDIDTLSLVSNSVNELAQMGDMERQILFRVATAKQLKDGKTIFTQGEMCDTFYVVISGCCGVYVSQDQIVERMQAQLSRKEAEKLKNAKANAQATKITELGPLDTFGMPIQDASPALQTTTVVTRGPCILLGVKHSVYKEALDEFNKKNVPQILEFLRGTQAFYGCPREELQELAQRVTYRTLSATSCLLKQGEKVGDIYILRLGKARLVKFYGNTVVELGEIGSGEVVGERIALTLHNNHASQQFSVLAGTLVKAFMVTRADISEVMSTCHYVRKALLKIMKERELKSENIPGDLNVTTRWYDYKRSVVRELLPAKCLMPAIDSHKTRSPVKNSRKASCIRSATSCSGKNQMTTPRKSKSFLTSL